MKHRSILAALLVAAAPIYAHASDVNSQSKENSAMISESAEVESVRQAINDLIQTATTYDVATLDRIYHDSLHVVMIDAEHNVSTADKAAFKGLFASKREAGDPPMNTWAKFHRIEVDGDAAHVLLSRKNDLSGTNMDLLLSIDLVREGGNWQVTREVIYLQPEKG